MTNVPPNQRPPDSGQPSGGYESPGGSPQAPPPPPTYQPQPGGFGQQQTPAAPGATPPGRVLTIIAFAMAAIALLFIPPLFGLVGVILAVIAMSKGDPLAKWALVASIAGAVVGMIIGVIVFAAND